MLAMVMEYTKNDIEHCSSYHLTVHQDIYLFIAL